MEAADRTGRPGCVGSSHQSVHVPGQQPAHIDQFVTYASWTTCVSKNYMRFGLRRIGAWRCTKVGDVR
jgi:hypothetical protein